MGDPFFKGGKNAVKNSIQDFFKAVSRISKAMSISRWRTSRGGKKRMTL